MHLYRKEGLLRSEFWPFGNSQLSKVDGCFDWFSARLHKAMKPIVCVDNGSWKVCMNTPVGQIDKMFSFMETQTSYWIPWVPEIFSRVWRGASSAAGQPISGLRPKTRAAKPREKTTRAGRPDLPCLMNLDLISNLSIKPAVARLLSQFKSNYQERNDALQPKESNYL